MQINECKIKSYIGNHRIHYSNLLFFIQTILHNSSKNASYNSSLWAQTNSAGFYFSILSYNNCLIFLSYSVSQGKLEQIHLTFSCCKGLPRFQAHIPGGLVFFSYTFILVRQEVFFPEWRPRGTGLQLSNTLGGLEKALFKSQKQQRRP